ncbi:MAG: hypothetical protein PHH40_04390 [Candidatus Moranbacteria bacterium]|nr:hypothetical protein [Candidatus Moranbacteria bacterium]MDD3964525.1 hypothetical protein [Candidatus Moranbacteria bacterium]
MKQVLFAVVATVVIATPLMAGAVVSSGVATPEGFNPTATGNAAWSLSDNTVFDLVTNVMNWLLGLIGVLGVIAFVISGIMYLTAAGDEGQIEKAKSIMMYAIIGLVIALIGLIVVNAIGGITGTTTTTTF